jgi:hypothetical protein
VDEGKEQVADTVTSGRSGNWGDITRKKKGKKASAEDLQRWLGEPESPGPKRTGVTTTRTNEMKIKMHAIHSFSQGKLHEANQRKTFLPGSTTRGLCVGLVWESGREPK